MNALEQLEDFMRRQALRFYDGEARGMPPMVRIFKDLRGQSDLPPTQEMFVRACVARAVDDPDGTRARAARTYPSLVRQQHFLVTLQTMARFDGVHWVPSLDLQGIDILVFHRGCALGVALSMRSDAAAMWAQVKALRHPPLAGLHMVSLDVDLRNAPRVGAFAVHPLSDTWLVQKEMAQLMTSQLPREGEWRSLFDELKRSRQLRAKAGFNDAVPLLKAVYGRIRKQFEAA